VRQINQPNDLKRSEKGRQADRYIERRKIGRQTEIERREADVQTEL
jgi:hypothetical protein